MRGACTCQCSQVTHPDDADSVRSAHDRVHVLAALALALDRHAEVLAVIAASPDRSAAVEAVRELLRVDPMQAGAVLDLRWDRLTTKGRQQIVKEWEHARQHLTNYPPRDP